VSRPRILFVTYYRLVPTGQIGVFKRCMRLVRHLHEDYDIHLVNYGPLPSEDAVVLAIRDYIHVHDLPEIDLGEELWQLYGELEPSALILGETPLRGNMRLSHRVGIRRGLYQIAIENLYARRASRFLERVVPRVDRYLLLGLGPRAEVGAIDGKAEAVPPLVTVRRPVDDTPRHRLCLVGYDKATLVSGLQLTSRLPESIAVDVFTVPDWSHIVEGHRDGGSREIRTHVYPTDEEIYDALSHAHVVFGKAGFQQVVEALLLGARVVCRQAGGGLEPYLLPEHLAPHVRFLDDDADIPEVATTVRDWFHEPVVGTWLPIVREWPDTMVYAAGRLRAAIEAAQ
jgi:hypothetical protein